jgi:hypothetical protein
VTNSTGSTLDVVDVSDPAAPALLERVPLPGSPNSVDVQGDLVAVAVEADPKTDRGSVVFLSRAGDILATVPVGALPDMITFTDDGRFLLVANKGEPSGYAGGDPAERPRGVRRTGPRAGVHRDRRGRANRHGDPPGGERVRPHRPA